MPKEIKNLGQEILYAAPGAFTLLFAGAGGYMSQGDPAVRDQLENTKHQVRHWAKCYQWGARYMPLLVLGGTITSVAAYQQSKEKLWLVGSGVLLSIIPYTLLIMKKTNGSLH
jgi:hypothetical protein